MRSDKQNEASRKNGTKSSGPVTPEGKAASSRNAVSHNLCAGHVVLLSNEDPREYYQHLVDFHQRFQPIDGVERELVDKLIAASWRDRRITNMETALYEMEMDRQAPDVDEEFAEIAPPGRQLLALLGTDDTKTAANLLLRYSATNRRSFSSAFRILKELQGDRFNKPSAMQQPMEPHHLQDHDQQSSPPAASTATSRASRPVHSAFAVHILTIRRHRNREARQPYHLENTKLPNEPKRALAAGQSPGAVSLQAA